MPSVYKFNPTTNKYTQISDKPLKKLSPEQEKVIEEILNQGQNLIKSIKIESTAPFLLLLISLSLLTISVIFAVYAVFTKQYWFLSLLIFPIPIAFAAYMSSKAKKDEIKERRNNPEGKWRYGKDQAKVLFKFYDKFSLFDARKCAPVGLKFSFGLAMVQESSVDGQILKFEKEIFGSKISKISKISSRSIITGKAFYIKFSEKNSPERVAHRFKNYRKALIEKENNFNLQLREMKKKAIEESYNGNEVVRTNFNVEITGKDHNELKRRKSLNDMDDYDNEYFEDFGEFYFEDFFDDENRRAKTPQNSPTNKIRYKKFMGGRRDYGIKFTVFRNEEKSLIGGSEGHILS